MNQGSPFFHELRDSLDEARDIAANVPIVGALARTAMSEERRCVIAQISEHILATHRSHPTRVGISGITASGKSTFATELAMALQTSGRQIIRTSIDAFHNPSHGRYRLGRDSADGYYIDAHDYDSIRRLLLEPLGPNGDFDYRDASFDLETDTPVKSSSQRSSKDAILVVDGTFLFKGVLREHWDYKIYLDVHADVARARGVARDAKAGDGKDWNALYRRRYHAACARYLAEWDPAGCADARVDNTDPQAPILGSSPLMVGPEGRA